ncbi:CDP-diacylglycerol--glycerol-3-phosphate 3-phosphatidyltransferase [Herbiconiux moechotypicola]|uniref:CDP-diacylglycerol--glycerol-3-phosphate 3-phosphatidyltransferase n=1 Tax=Herbiconiux moechotypicola TaxID=637393 RepID=A0ABP5QHG2_9MICO|nr:CDP-diacylglycerol--glycerol-3-phosphate 3-phosphatidyltransferase [Herbiconiux moechotypicola]MCS5729881.1 CDP-diacylglycerol--glycerol-3-phosphate 3-phosphatidyltransferase [Herbiconiux moechotypicola]
MSADEVRVSNWNLPNAITIVRILLAPVFFVMLLVDGHDHGALRWAAAVLFILAIATDGIDGHIARSRGLVTDLGKLLDPIADKVLTGAALIGLSILGELPWWVTALILVREVGITVWRFVQLKDRVIPASRGGKLKTLVQSIAISLALLPFPALFGGWVDWVNTVFMALALVLTVVTGIDYLVQAWRLNRPAPGAPSNPPSSTR